MRLLALITLFYLVFAASSVAQSDLEHSLDDIDLMVGHWVNGDDEYKAEEVWFAPRAGVMAGAFYWPFDGGPRVLELLTFVEESNGLAFYFRHFDQGIDPWEKEESIRYRVTTVRDSCLYMVRTSDHEGTPFRISYCKQDKDTLQFIGVDEGQGWDDADFIITYTRVQN